MECFVGIDVAKARLDLALEPSGAPGGRHQSPAGFRDTTIVLAEYATISQPLTRFISGFVSIDNLTNNQAYEFRNDNLVMGRIATRGVKVHY